MKSISVFILFLLTFAKIAAAQQKIIQLYEGKARGSENWNWEEKEMFSPIFNTEVVYNVSKPSLTVYLPDKNIATGTAVIIAPGGGFHTLSINSEGIDVAKWLNAKGVAAFVLKYRLAHSLTDDPVKELMTRIDNAKKMDSVSNLLIPLAMQDGLTAVKYVRSHADEFGINPDKIGFMGFSAGGTVTMTVAYNSNAESRPNFIAPVYAYNPPSIFTQVPKEGMPAFIVVASDDHFGFAPGSIDIYNKWTAAKQAAELHIFEKGGHGFGLRKQNLPSDKWIERFGEWLKQKGLLEPLIKPQYTAEQLEEFKRKETEKLRNDWANLGKYAAENKELKPAQPGEQRIVFMGNSITEGWKDKHPEFFEGKAYINRGIGGQTTPQMLLRFRQDVLDLKPKVVVILAGINDIAGNTGPATLENIMANLISMAELAKSNQIKVVLSSVLPAYDFVWRPGLEPAEKVVKLNTMIKMYADKNGIVYLDYFSAMVDERKGLESAYTEDGVHPNLAGYKIMEPLVEKAIAEALKRK